MESGWEEQIRDIVRYHGVFGGAVGEQSAVDDIHALVDRIVKKNAKFELLEALEHVERGQTLEEYVTRCIEQIDTDLAEAGEL